MVRYIDGYWNGEGSWFRFSDVGRVSAFVKESMGVCRSRWGVGWGRPTISPTEPPTEAPIPPDVMVSLNISKGCLDGRRVDMGRRLSIGPRQNRGPNTKPMANFFNFCFATFSEKVREKISLALLKAAISKHVAMADIGFGPMSKADIMNGG